jgi:DNA polymerase IIIc chi subunit
MRSKKMEKNLEVNIAFRIWNQINQLDSILWDRYRDDFLNLNLEQDDEDPSYDDSQDVDDPF